MTARENGEHLIEYDLRARLAELVRDVPDYPQAGIVFKDITPVLAEAATFSRSVDWMAAQFAGGVDVVVGIEARGFILGAPVAKVLGVGFVPVRKVGKLPFATVSEAYTLEYGQAVLEMHSDALVPGQRVLIVDDVIATGGTARATVALVQTAGALVTGISALLAIDALGGRQLLEGYDLRVLLTA